MSEITNALNNIPDISFIDEISISELQEQMIKDFEEEYERITGTKMTLAKADPNRLTINATALQIYQCLQYIDRAGKQSLLKYSYGEFLDNLAVFKGVKRLEATAAKTIIRFTLSEVRESVTTIQKGIRCTGESGLYFKTLELAEIPSGSLYVDIEAECETEGVIGNDYTEGKIDTLVDLIPYIDSVKNMTKTSGGSEMETDEDLAERTYLAPSGYSVAGPEDAYSYWAKSVNSSISDPKITSNTAGVVDIRILMKDGSLPDEAVIQELGTFLSDKKIRPLTDKVVVSAPEEDEYSIDFTYYINRSDANKVVAIQEAVNKSVEEYNAWQRKIGRDINPSKLMNFIILAGAKRAEITEPIYKKVDEIRVSKVTTINVVYGGVEDD